jgi:predicted phosphodiesterase
MRKKLGKADAVLVSGDISYSGKREEFEDAAQWLEEVCTAAGCEPYAVLMCPGNHDVDQSVITNNPLIQDGQDAIRREQNHYARDRALVGRLTQPEARALFYSPIAAYNEFAARYQSSFFADSSSFAWEHDFTLNDGSLLRIRALNSALLSGYGDYRGGLFLGTRAWTIPEQSGVEYLVMSHHPPSWLLDGAEAEASFNGAARIHLFGHEHDQRILPGRDWVKLFAGAVNPHRAEPNWRPGYNIIDVSVETKSSRTLVVHVHAREWQGAPPQFRSIEDVGNSPIFEVRIKLKNLPERSHNAEAQSAPVTQPKLPAINAAKPVERPLMDPKANFRRLVFRFFKLSLSKKNELIGHLRLVEENDSRLTDVERFKLCLLRARERDQLGELKEMLDKLEETDGGN